MPRQQLTFTGWQPCKLNTLINLHWAERGRRKVADYQVVATTAFQQGLTRANGKRRVSLIIRHRKGVKPVDPDSYWKVIADALVKCGLLKDDSGEWMESGSVSYEVAKEKGLVVVLEDL